jgi:DNA-binding transcriptional LysR family regulator
MPAPKPNANRASRLKTRHLLLLVRLAEHASLVGAAHAANMSQPAASRLLGEMEALLRVPLFERHARGVTATRYGESLIRHARLALADIERAHEDIAALRDGRVGNVAIGTVVNPGTHLLPRARPRKGI